MKVIQRLATRLVCRLYQGVVAGVVGTTLMLAGCSTVVSRVEQHSTLFESLDRQTQAVLLNGQAEIGYTMDMAYIAFGAPNELRRQQTETGNSITWIYQYPGLLDYHGTSAHSYSLFSHRLGGYHYSPHHPYHGSHAVRDYLRIVFVDGRITSIEDIE